MLKHGLRPVRCLHFGQTSHFCVTLLGVQSALVDGRANTSLNGCYRFWLAHLSHNGVAVHKILIKIESTAVPAKCMSLGYDELSHALNSEAG